MSGLFTRRSVREFTDRPVEKEVIERVLRAGMQAPSALGLRPWVVVVAEKPALRLALSQMGPNAGPAAKAPVVLVNCADMRRAHPGGEPKQWWIQDMAACTQNQLLQIADEGLGGVWLGCYPKGDRVAKVQAVLGLPDHLVPFSLVAFGQDANPRPATDNFDPTRVHWNGYNTCQDT